MFRSISALLLSALELMVNTRYRLGAAVGAFIAITLARHDYNFSLDVFIIAFGQGILAAYLISIVHALIIRRRDRIRAAEAYNAYAR